MANAYVVGVLEGATLATEAAVGRDGAKTLGICPPKNQKMGDLVEAIGKYLAAHPELRQLPAKASVLIAANKTSECKGRNKDLD